MLKSNSFLCHRIIEKIHKKLPNKLLTFNEYPDLDLDGNDDKQITPALELIKCICKVFIVEFFI